VKYFIYILITIAIGLIIYNSTFLNFDNMLSEDSGTALISILAAACVILLLCILLVSRAIQNKKRNK